MLQKLQNLAAFSSACQALRAGKSPLLLDGLAAVHKAHFAAALCRELGRGAVLLTDEEAAATRLMEDIASAFTARNGRCCTPSGSSPTTAWKV